MSRRINQERRPPSPLPATLPELARKCFELSKQNLMLLQRIVSLEELILQTRLYVQQGQTFITALAHASRVRPEIFAEAIVAMNTDDKRYEGELIEALKQVKDRRAREAAGKAKDIKEIV